MIWRRRLVVLLAFAMSPVVVIATSVPADAVDTQVSPTATATVSAPDGSIGKIPTDPGTKTTCSVSARWEVTAGQGPGATYQRVVKGKAKCSTGFEVASSRVLLSMGGTGCSTLKQTTRTEVDGSPNVDIFLTDTGTTCVVDELCLNTVWEGHGFFGHDFEDSNCVPFGLGAAPEYVPPSTSNGTCADLAVSTPTASATFDDFWAPNSNNKYRAWVRAQNINWPVSQQDTTKVWIPYAIVDQSLIPGDASNRAVTLGSQPGDPLSWKGRTTEPYVVGGQGSVLPLHVWYDQTVSGESLNAVRPVRVGPMANTGTAGGSPTTQEWAPVGRVVGVGVALQNVGTANLNFPTQNVAGVFGVTDPSLCRFYWGAKIIDLPNTTTDNPMGQLGQDGQTTTPVEPPPLVDPTAPEEDTGCAGFSFSDPTTWAGAGICVLVKLLGQLVTVVRGILGMLGDVIDAIGSIVAAIADLVADLVAGFASLLKELFIPDPTAWDIGPTLASFQSRPPGSVVVGLGQLVTGTVSSFTGSSSDCTIWPGVSGKGQLTCADVRDAPGINALYFVMQLGIVTLAVFAGFKLISAQVGSDQ